MRLLLQIPPLPPINPFHGRDLETLLIGLTIVAITFVAASLLKPLAVALARRIEGRGTNPAIQAELEQLRDQVAELEPLSGRVHELEERLEFAERLLAQRRDQELLPRPERSR